MANSDFLDVLSPSALADLQKANVELTTMIKNVSTLNSKKIGTPSSADNSMKNLSVEYAKQEKLIADLQKSLLSLNSVRQTSNQRTQEEITNQSILAQNAKRNVLANSQLAGAYRNLSAQVAIASEKYQNLIVRGKTAQQTQSAYNRELRNAQKEFQTLQNRVLQADKAVDKWNRTGERSIGFMRNLIGAFGIAGGVTLFATIATDIFRTTKELQSLDNALKLVAETQENFYRQQTFLKKIAESYGTELTSLTKQFTQFYVSAKDKISGTQIQEIFESITKAGASMGLSTEQQERAFLALNQMMSKGTIQAEELRGQLGEALPGAFGIMAKAIGVTEKELGNMMKAGDVLASEVLPKFAKQLEITYGIENLKRIDNLTGAQNRLTNAWKSLVASLNEDGNKLSGFFTLVIDESTMAVNGWRKIFSSSATLRKNELNSIKTSNEELAKSNLKVISDVDQRTEYASKKIIELQNEKRKALDEALKLEKRNNEIINSTDPNINDVGGRGLRGFWEKEVKKNQIEIAKYNNTIAKTQGLINGYATALEKKKPIVKEDIELTKAQLKAIEDLKKAEEERLKNLYERELSDLERKKDISQANFEDEKQYAEKRIQLSEDVALYENLIALRRFQENLRLHKDSLDLQKIDANNYQTEQENIVKRSEDRILKIRKDNFDAFTEYRQKYGKPADEETFGTGVTFLPTEQLDELIQGYEKLNEEKKKSKKLTEDEKKAVEDYIATFKESFMNEAGFPTLFKVLNDEIAGFGDNWRTTFLAIGEIAKEAFEFISEASNANFENEYNNLEKQKNVALLFAGDSASAREEIERQYEERQRAIRRREFQAQKATALFNIAINTAQGIVSALASRPPNVPLSIAIGAIGAIQAGVVASRQIPEFWKGTDNAPEGFALTQERGREIITDKHGNIKSTGSDKGAQLTYLNKGDKVLTNDKTMDFLMFNSDLNNILSNNGIGSQIVNVQGNTTDLTPVVNAINSKETFQLTIDENGLTKRIRNGHSTKEIIARRTNFSGYGV